MSNRAKITIGGETYEVALRLREMREFKERTGHDLMKGDAEFNDTENVIAFFYVLLKSADPDLTEEKVMEMIDLAEIPGLVEQAFVLVRDAMPEPEEGVAEPRPLREMKEPAKSSTG